VKGGTFSGVLLRSGLLLPRHKTRLMAAKLTSRNMQIRKLNQLKTQILSGLSQGLQTSVKGDFWRRRERDHSGPPGTGALFGVPGPEGGASIPGGGEWVGAGRDGSESSENGMGGKYSGAVPAEGRS